MDDNRMQDLVEDVRSAAELISRELGWNDKLAYASNRSLQAVKS
jgi:hypothetical protein